MAHKITPFLIFTGSAEEAMRFYVRTPSISRFVECESEAEFDGAFGQLSAGGAVLMPPDDYGFSSKFGG